MTQPHAQCAMSLVGLGVPDRLEARWGKEVAGGQGGGSGSVTAGVGRIVVLDNMRQHGFR